MLWSPAWYRGFSNHETLGKNESMQPVVEASVLKHGSSRFLFAAVGNSFSEVGFLRSVVVHTLSLWLAICKLESPKMLIIDIISANCWLCYPYVSCCKYVLWMCKLENSIMFALKRCPHWDLGKAFRVGIEKVLWPELELELKFIYAHTLQMRYN